MHYQLTFTARQAVGGFVALLVSLGLAFYFGLMSGLSGRTTPSPEEAERLADARGSDPSGPDSAEAVPPIETAVPTAVAPSGPLGSRTLIAGGPPQTPLTVPAEPTAPATLQTFQDGTGEEPEPTPAAAASVAGASGGSAPAESKPRAEAAAGKFWVQVASLTSREEAGSLSTRLSRRGFRSQILTAAGPKGKGKVYRVRVGPYRSEDDAERAATKLARQEHFKSPWVVPDGM